MLRIANKRKEQDMDFEEKKLHLSVGGVVHDPDAELAYAAAAVGASPPRHHDIPPAHYRDPEAFRYNCVLNFYIISFPVHDNIQLCGHPLKLWRNVS